MQSLRAPYYVDYVEAHRHEGAAYETVDHRARQTRVASHYDKALLIAERALDKCCVGSGKLHYIHTAEAFACAASDGSSDS